MAWDPSVPANNAALLSAPVRGNFAALDTQIVAPFAALANGQLLVKTAGVLAGVPVGTNGYILTLVGGVPLWQPAPTGVAFPLLAPDGSNAAPSYSFAAGPGAGLYAGTPHVFLKAGGGIGFVANGRTSSSWWIDAANALIPGDDAAFDLGVVANRLRDLWLSRSVVYSVGAAPATPAAGNVATYAKTDKKMYQKDDAGVETPLGGGGTAPAMVPLWLENARFPDGTANNAFPLPVERVSTGTPPSTNTPKLVELVYQFNAVTVQSLIWKGVIPPDYVASGAVTLVVKWSMAAATTGNVRILASFIAITDGSTDARAATGSETLSADLAVPGTLGQQKETRLALTAPTAAAGRKFLLSMSLLSGAASSATGDRVLESAHLEFARA